MCGLHHLTANWEAWQPLVVRVEARKGEALQQAVGDIVGVIICSSNIRALSKTAMHHR